MAQMTETLARDELSRIEAGDHPMFTRHEIEQLLRGWLKREDMRKDAERWRYWRNYWPALCRMEVARFARLDLRTTHVQSPADMDKVTDEAMQARTAVGAA